MATAKQTRPNQKAKWRDSLKPTDFSGIRGRVDNLSAHTDDYRNRSTGQYTVGVLKGRSGIDRNSIRTLDFTDEVQITGTRPTKEDIIEQYKLENPQYANVSNNRIITMRPKPKVEFDDRGRMNLPSDTKTLQTMIKDFVGGLKQIQKSTLTIKNIESLVQNSGYSPSQATLNKINSAELGYRGEAKQQQTPLLASILKAFIKAPDRGLEIYPLQVVPSTAMLPKKYGIAVANSIAVDFGEVVGPVALITGNATGNAARVSREFLGATTAELMAGATIHFNAGATDPLYDCFVEYGGKVIGISSKGHAGGNAASAGTSMSSLAQAINEVKSNARAVRLLKDLLADPENRVMFDVVSILATESNHGQKWEKTLRMLQLLDKNYSSSDMYGDIRHIRSLGSAKNTNTRDADARTKSNATRALTSGLSQYMLNKMAAAPARRKEDRTPFAKFLRATNDEITRELNSNPKFSEICSWILNHSATVQIDLYTGKSEVAEGRRPAANYGDALVLTNIVATWPSTRVDRIELLENNKDLRFMLGVNGYSEKFPDRAAMPFADTDFKDMIAAKATDRDGSKLTTAADWAQSGVHGARTTTDLHDLPKNTATVAAPTQAASTPKSTHPAAGAPKAAKAASPTAAAKSGALSALSNFLASRNLTKARQSVDYACKLIYGLDGSANGELAAFIRDFKVLLSNPVIADLAVHGVDSSLLGESTLSEGLTKFQEHNVASVISLYYWSLMLRQRVASGAHTTDVETQLHKALSDLSPAAELKRNLDRAINGLKASVRSSAQRPQSQPATQPAAARVQTTTAKYELEKLFSAVYQQRGDLFKTLQQVSADEKEDAFEEAKSMFIDGTSVPEIIASLRSTFGLRESSIMNGILQSAPAEQ